MQLGRLEKGARFFSGCRSDDEEGCDRKASGNTCRSRNHLAAMPARPVHARSATCRNDRSIEFRRIGIDTGQCSTGAFGMGLELKHVRPAPAVNRWSPHAAMVLPACKRDVSDLGDQADRADLLRCDIRASAAIPKRRVRRAAAISRARSDAFSLSVATTRLRPSCLAR